MSQTARLAAVNLYECVLGLQAIARRVARASRTPPTPAKPWASSTTTNASRAAAAVSMNETGVACRLQSVLEGSLSGPSKVMSCID